MTLKATIDEIVAACAHKQVEHNPVHHGQGRYSDRWTCRDCDAEFEPSMRAEALAKLLEEAEPLWKNRARIIHERWTKIGKVSTDPYDTTHVRFLALALCGEAGELANLIKKSWRGDSIKTEDIAAELADVRIYLEHLSHALNVDLDAACEAKIAEVENRLAHEEMRG